MIAVIAAHPARPLGGWRSRDVGPCTKLLILLRTQSTGRNSGFTRASTLSQYLSGADFWSEPSLEFFASIDKNFGVAALHTGEARISFLRTCGVARRILDRQCVGAGGVTA